MMNYMGQSLKCAAQSIALHNLMYGMDSYYPNNLSFIKCFCLLPQILCCLYILFDMRFVMCLWWDFTTFNFWIELQILTSSVEVKFQAEHIFRKMFINILNKKAILVTHFLFTYFVVFISTTHLLTTHFNLFINIFSNI